MNVKHFKFDDENFDYVKGFFEVPYVSNSPQAMLESIISRPFVKHDSLNKKVEAENELMKGSFYYQELEEGLWFIYSDFTYKENINFKRIDLPGSPANYYMLALEIVEGEENSKPILINGIPYSNISWLLYKPKISSVRTHFKGTKERSFAVFFNQQWLDNTLAKDKTFRQSSLSHFFVNRVNYLIWPDDKHRSSKVYQTIYPLVGNSKKDVPQLKKEVRNLILYFINRYEKDAGHLNLFSIPDSDRIKIIKAQDVLIQSLNQPFMGIENLAKNVSMSPTKLKNNFKLAFGETVFHYFRKKQMEEASKRLKQKGGAIKEIAASFHFSNASKFTAAFKKHMGVLPSKILK